MAAHALRIIRETLYERGPINETTCEQLQHACSYAPGMDDLEMDDWKSIYDASCARDVVALKIALELVEKRVAYMSAYRNCEDHRAARRTFVAYDTRGWLDRAKAFAALPESAHADLAIITQATYVPKAHPDTSDRALN